MLCNAISLKEEALVSIKPTDAAEKEKSEKNGNRV
jgi:hypothetical protein